jgi:hypothetical protein
VSSERSRRAEANARLWTDFVSKVAYASLYTTEYTADSMGNIKNNLQPPPSLPSRKERRKRLAILRKANKRGGFV